MGTVSIAMPASGNVGSAFVLPDLRREGRPGRRIIGGYVKKCGAMLLGLHKRWIVLFDNATLSSNILAEHESNGAQKMYDLAGSTVEWGTLGGGEYALRIMLGDSAKKKHRRSQITFVVGTRPELARWIGAMRCMYASTDAILCPSGSKGGDMCAICLSDFETGDELSVLPCDHRFCTECIGRWLRSSPTCPQCRASALIEGEPLVRKGIFAKESKGASASKRRGSVNNNQKERQQNQGVHNSMPSYSSSHRL